VRGASFLEGLRWYARVHGEEHLFQMVAAIPSPWRDLVDPERPALGVQPSSWYPSELINAIWDVVTDHLSPSERTTLARDCATAVMNGTLHGVYRVLFNLLATPERFAKNAQRLWDANYDTGTVTMRLTGPSTMLGATTGWRGHHAFACEITHFAGLATLEAMGCRDVRSSLSCLLDNGGRTCEGVFTWR
jgi:hypothetical protein